MRMQGALEGPAGIRSIADDILVYGLCDDGVVTGGSPAEAEADHDRILVYLQALLFRAQARNLKLTQLKFMGHHVSEEGVAPDPAKVEAILQFPQPTSKPALQRFLGMANYLNAFCPYLSSVTHPLFQLTWKGTEFQWPNAFEAACRLGSQTHICLAFLDQQKPVTLN